MSAAVSALCKLAGEPWEESFKVVRQLGINVRNVEDEKAMKVWIELCKEQIEMTEKFIAGL